jgi:hypothetical protein
VQWRSEIFLSDSGTISKGSPDNESYIIHCKLKFIAMILTASVGEFLTFFLFYYEHDTVIITTKTGEIDDTCSIKKTKN